MDVEVSKVEPVLFDEGSRSCLNLKRLDSDFNGLFSEEELHLFNHRRNDIVSVRETNMKVGGGPEGIFILVHTLNGESDLVADAVEKEFLAGSETRGGFNVDSLKSRRSNRLNKVVREGVELLLSPLIGSLEVEEFD